MHETKLPERWRILLERYLELETLLADPALLKDLKKRISLEKEHAEIASVARDILEYQALQIESLKMQALMEEAEMRALAIAEQKSLQERRSELEMQLQAYFLPVDPDDQKNIFLEVYAGTGGEEAALFACDLLKIYTRYAQQKGWLVEIVHAQPSEHGGLKEFTLRIAGPGAYGRLKFESGGHRVQRIPKTETQGRIHTSSCTVAVLPETPEKEGITLDPSVLRIDTFRASGAGGQHVNKTDSAIRITHIPTGTVVECQQERSQHKNRAKALALLQAKLSQKEKEKQKSQEAETRKRLLGSGDRSERIRTYNIPQGRLTDHRVHLTLYQLDQILEGNLDLVIVPLVKEYQGD